MTSTTKPTCLAGPPGTPRSSAGRPVLDEDVEAGGSHHTVFALGGGLLYGLHKHQDEVGTPFDERRPGTDHVAFNGADRTELEK